MKHLFETEIEMEWLKQKLALKSSNVKYAKLRIILDKKLSRIKNYKKNTIALVLFRNLRNFIPN